LQPGESLLQGVKQAELLGSDQAVLLKANEQLKDFEFVKDEKTGKIT